MRRWGFTQTWPGKPSKRAKKEATEAKPLQTKSAKAAATGGPGCDGKGKSTQAMPENKRSHSKLDENSRAKPSKKAKKAVDSGSSGAAAKAAAVRDEEHWNEEEYDELEKRHEDRHGDFQPCAEKDCPLCCPSGRER